MNALALTIDGERGYLFETTHSRGVVAFVPEAILSEEGDADAEFNQASYLNSGWAAKNARFNLGEASKYAFPVLNCPVHRADERGVAQFLQRIRHAYAVELDPISAN